VADCQPEVTVAVFEPVRGILDVHGMHLHQTVCKALCLESPEVQPNQEEVSSAREYVFYDRHLLEECGKALAI
jgi:hypothetical protein